MQQKARAHGFTGLTILLPCPEVAGLMEQWNGLLKTQLQCQLDDTTLQGWGKVTQKVVPALNQHPVYGAISPTVRIRWARNQGVDMAVAHILLP